MARDSWRATPQARTVEEKEEKEEEEEEEKQGKEQEEEEEEFSMNSPFGVRFSCSVPLVSVLLFGDSGFRCPASVHVVSVVLLGPFGVRRSFFVRGCHVSPLAFPYVQRVVTTADHFSCRYATRFYDRWRPILAISRLATVRCKHDKELCTEVARGKASTGMTVNIIIQS